MIRSAQEGDAEPLRRLWSGCFLGEEEFDEYYFKNVYKAENTLLCFCDGELAASLQRLKYELAGDRLTYIYGAMTREKYRKRGLMSQLLNYSEKMDRRDGIAASVLIPANKNLFGYYGRRGYKTAFYVDKIRAVKTDKQPLEIHNSVAAEVFEIYNTLQIPHIYRSPEYIQNQIEMYTSLGGFALACEGGFCFGYFEDELNIEEMVCDKKLCESFINSVLNRFGAGAANVILPNGDIPLGMLKPYKKLNFDRAYMNLMYN